MILCEEARQRPDSPSKVDLLGIVSAVFTKGEAEYPLLHPRLCVFVQMTNGRGQAELAVHIRLEETGMLVSGSPTHSVLFGKDPLAVSAMFFNLRNVRFPHPGLYSVELVVSGQVVAREPLLLR
jgi:hypothetical protein